MPTAFMRMISKLVSWQSFLLLLVILVLCLLGFNWRSQQFKLDADHRLLDSQFWYSPEEVRNFFEFLGSKLSLYALTQVTLDFIFPITYGLIFTIIITHLFSEEVVEKIIVVPLLATIFDLSENFILAYLAVNFVGEVSPLAWLAGVFTSLKWITSISSVLLIFGGVIYRYVLRQ